MNDGLQSQTMTTITNNAETCLQNIKCNDYKETDTADRRRVVMKDCVLCSTGYWLRFLRPTRHKIGNFGDIPQANLLAWYGKKQNLTLYNESTHSPTKEMYNTK